MVWRALFADNEREKKRERSGGRVPRERTREAG